MVLWAQGLLDAGMVHVRMVADKLSPAWKAFNVLNKTFPEDPAERHNRQTSWHLVCKAIKAVSQDSQAPPPARAGRHLGCVWGALSPSRCSSYTSSR